MTMTIHGRNLWFHVHFDSVIYFGELNSLCWSHKFAKVTPCGRLKFLLEENIVQRVIQAAHWKSQLNSSTTADTLYLIHILLSLGKFQSLITSVRSFYLHAWKFTEAKTSTSGENGLFVYELFYSFYKTNVY